MICQDVQERLTDALLGEAPPSVREELLDHAAGCAGCADAAEQLRQTLELLRASSWPAEAVLDDAGRRRLFERARTRRRPIGWIAAAAALAGVALAAGVGVPALQRARREPAPVPPPTLAELAPPVTPTPAPAAPRALPVPAPPAVSTPPTPTPAPSAPAPAAAVVAAGPIVREAVVPPVPTRVPSARPRRFPDDPDPVPVPRRERDDRPAAPAPQAAVLVDPTRDGWIPPRRGEVSGFGFDVGTSSLALVREALLDGRLPRPSDVRVEEFVNAIAGEEPTPEGEAFRIGLESARSPFDPSRSFLRVGIRAGDVPRRDRKSVRLVFVVDLSARSGTRERLGLLKSSLQRLVERLDGGDSIGIVASGGVARVVLAPTPGDDREAVLEALAGLSPDGTTNVDESLQMGYALASDAFEPGAVNRVVLCTDGAGGDPAGEALQQARRRASAGIALAVLRLRPPGGDEALQQLARDGHGPYASASDEAELRRFLLGELSQLEGVVARHARVEVAFDPARVRVYRLLGRGAGGSAPVRGPRVGAVEGGDDVHGGQTVTALYELWVSPGEGPIGSIRVRYESPEARAPGEVSRAIRGAAFDRAFDGASARFQLTVLAGRFAEHLRREWPDEPFELLHETAQRARPRVSSLDRDTEILPMIRAAGRLMGVRE